MSREFSLMPGPLQLPEACKLSGPQPKFSFPPRPAACISFPTRTIQSGEIMQHSYEWLTLLCAGLCVACLLGCAATNSTGDPAGSATVITRNAFGKTRDGQAVDIFTLRNSKGAEVRILNYGGIVVSFTVPDKHGKMGDVVLGYDNLESYLKQSPYFGCLVGRYGNRIAHGKFTLDGTAYTLATNNYPNAIHGGLKGFDKAVWQAKIVAHGSEPSLEL